MHFLIRITVCLALSGLLALAAAPEAAVEQAERDWGAAVAKSDLPALERLLASDLVYTHSNGIRDTQQSFIEGLRTGKLKYIRIAHQKIEVHMIKNDVAFVAARADFRVIPADKVVDMQLSMLHVFVKRQGRWQLLAHQSARLP